MENQKTDSNAGEALDTMERSNPSMPYQEDPAMRTKPFRLRFFSFLDDYFFGDPLDEIEDEEVDDEDEVF